MMTGVDRPGVGGGRGGRRCFRRDALHGRVIAAAGREVAWRGALCPNFDRASRTAAVRASVVVNQPTGPSLLPPIGVNQGVRTQTRVWRRASRAAGMNREPRAAGAPGHAWPRDQCRPQRSKMSN